MYSYAGSKPRREWVVHLQVRLGGDSSPFLPPLLCWVVGLVVCFRVT